jgi:Leucine-rich repeat (LRR) protein
MLPSSLVTLDVCNNLLADLPVHLVAIPGLWNLFVNGNKLASLPAWVEELQSLRRFSFAGNPIPASFEQKQLAANVQMSINLRELARQGKSSETFLL